MRVIGSKKKCEARVCDRDERDGKAKEREQEGDDLKVGRVSV